MSWWILDQHLLSYVITIDEIKKMIIVLWFRLGQTMFTMLGEVAQWEKQDKYLALVQLPYSFKLHYSIYFSWNISTPMPHRFGHLRLWSGLRCNSISLRIFTVIFTNLSIAYWQSLFLTLKAFKLASRKVCCVPMIPRNCELSGP